MPDGSLKLIGADYLVIAEHVARQARGDAGDDGPALPPFRSSESVRPTRVQETPEMMGQLFHLFEAPNRFGLPAFYTLHVWAWKDNPNGAFVNWHPHVSCDSFAGQNH